MSGDDPDIKEDVPLPVRKPLQCLDWLYEGAINGIPGVDGLEDLAQSYSAQHPRNDDAIDRLINWQVAKAGAAGFVTGVGGMLTLPVAIPANLVGVLYIQIRMIGAVAHLRGYDVRSDQVRTLVVACLAGSAALDILKGVGINIGTQVTRQMVLRISGEVLKRINQAVGFRLVTKAGSKGVVNLVKGVPLVGGVVGGLSTPLRPRSSAGQRGGCLLLSGSFDAVSPRKLKSHEARIYEAWHEQEGQSFNYGDPPLLVGLQRLGLFQSKQPERRRADAS